MSLSRRSFLGCSATLAAGLTARIAVRPAWPQPAVLDDEVSSAIDAVARASIEAGACPGISVRIARRGRTLFSRSYGLANIETNSVLTDDGVFRIGSLTKQFTAALILELASRGRLALDDAASRSLPFFATARPFTVRELLTHTAGLHSDEQSSSCPTGRAKPRSQVELAREIAAQRQLFDFEPGTAWLYSNANYIVLGAIVEALAARPLADAASAVIFEPLALRRTAFDTSATVVAGRVAGYAPVEGSRRAFTHAPFLEVAETGGAGAMRSTTAELCEWHHALFTNRLFDARLVELMVTPGRLRDGRLSGRHRFSADDASYGDVQYGMGLLVSPASDAHRGVIHYGAINGFAACLETFIDVGLTTVILCNGDIGPHMPFRAMRRVVAERVLPSAR
jgi:CubicO group peptidase (beta-lactamase class C family)